MSSLREPTSRRRLDPLVLVSGLPGNPLHPPLTDATIGMYVLAGGLAIIGSAGGIESAAAKAMWLALIGGLIVSVPTALTGLVDWLWIEWGSARWRTATLHLTAMVSAVALFAARRVAAVQRLSAWPRHHRRTDPDALRRRGPHRGRLAGRVARVRARHTRAPHTAPGWAPHPGGPPSSSNDERGDVRMKWAA